MAKESLPTVHPAIASVLNHIGEATAVTQRVLDAGLGRARLQLKVWELRASPQTREWIQRAKDGVDDGSLLKTLAAQPDAKELVAKRRS